MKPLALVATLALAGVAGYGLLSVPAFQPKLSANDRVPNHFIVAPPAVTGAISGAVAPPFRMMVAQASSPIDTLLAQLKPEEAPATTPAPAPTPRPSNGKVDESALRYFAQQGDTVRLQREIERLRALYPGWQPPADPLADDYVPDPDITQIWELYSKGDYAGARAAIEAKQAKDPTFTPTEDLQSSLALGEAGQRLRLASDRGNYAEVIAIAANHGQLLVCDSVDNLWRLAQAFIAVGTPNRALDAYRYILNTCTDSAERYSTMQKAIDNFDRTTVEDLLALEKPGPSGVGEFAALRVDLARSAIAAALEEDGPEPSQEDVSIFEAALAQTDAPEDMRLLGYFELDRNRPNEARRLFQRAYDSDPSDASAEGLGVVLIKLRDFAAAEAVLANKSRATEKLSALYLDAAAALLSAEPRRALDQQVLGRIADATLSAPSANTAQELGWYAYAFQQPQTALEWFTLALRWQPDLEPAAYGIVVAANALGDDATVKSMQAQWAGRSVRITSFGKGGEALPSTVVPSVQQVALTSEPRVAATNPKPTQTVASSGGGGGGGGSTSSCTTYVPAASLSPGAALSRAWCMMRANRPAEAVDLFNRALQAPGQNTRSDAAYGLALAYVRMGLASEAAVAAAAAPLSSKQIIELDIAILTLRATSAYSIGDYVRALDALDQRARYAAERNDLLTLRAWSYYHLKRYREALQIFTAVAATGHGDAVAGLEATKRALMIFN